MDEEDEIIKKKHVLNNTNTVILIPLRVSSINSLLDCCGRQLDNFFPKLRKKNMPPSSSAL